MAALTSSRLNDLIERFFYPRRLFHRPVFEFQHYGYTAVRRFVVDGHPSPEKADDDWLHRTELRGSEAVISLLERSGFRDRRGEMHALFVDGRCGLIRSYPIECAANLEPERAVGDILAEASNCHADGIILATNDASGTVPSTRHWEKVVSDLYRKGEATEIFLLDHFVLTAAGWKRMFGFSRQEYS